MPRQIKWLLIMAAALAVIGLGQLGDSLATQPGGGEAHHGPPGAPPAPPPTAPPAPPPTVTVPGALARDLPPPPSEKPVVGGGCGPPPGRREEPFKDWRNRDFDSMADNTIARVNDHASLAIEYIRRDIKRAQKRILEADVEADKWQNRKKRGTLPDEGFLKDAQEERQKAWAELQRQQARIEKVEAWRTLKTREIWAMRDLAKNGDYYGYNALTNWWWGIHPSQYE